MPGKKPADQLADQRKGRMAGRIELDETVEEEEKQPTPLPPKGLLRSTYTIWREYWRSPVAKAVDMRSDRHRVDRWIHDVDEYDRVFPVFQKDRVAEGSKGQPTMSPLAGYLQQLADRIQAAERDLGLTPMARLRLGITVGKARLTAADIMKGLKAPPAGPAPEPEAWESEWEQA